jgi:hypothetical protein
VDNSIVELVNYKEDRKLYVTRSEYESNIQKTLTFDGCLCDPVASAYFRRFLRTQYSEESFLFYKEIVDFKAGKFATPSIGDPLRNGKRTVLARRRGGEPVFDSSERRHGARPAADARCAHLR